MTTNPFVNQTLKPENPAYKADTVKPLIIAQGLGAAFTSGNLYELNNNFEDWEALLGAGSQACSSVKAFKMVDIYTPLSIIPISDNASGVAATGSIAFTVSNPKIGILDIIVCDGIFDKYTINVLTTSTATSIGDELVAKITANKDSAVTASNSSGTVTFTAKNKGTSMNMSTIAIDGFVSGVTYTITAFSGGATDPVITNTLDKINEVQYDLIFPKAFLSVVKSHLDAKWNTPDMAIESIGHFDDVDTYANITSSLAINTLNTKTIQKGCIKLANESNHKGASKPVNPLFLTAYRIAINTLRAFPDSAIEKYMLGGNIRGGIDKLGIPYANNILYHLPVIRQKYNWTTIERKAINDLGGSTYGIDDTGTYTLTEINYMTCFKKATESADGNTYYNLNKVHTSRYVKAYFQKRIKKDWAQAGLTNGATPNIPDNKYIDVQGFRNYMSGLYQELGELGIVQPGKLTDFLKSIVLNIETASGKISGSYSFFNMGQFERADFVITPKN